MDPRKLYKIFGGDDASVKRVEAAMDWLLSPEADGEGERLLLKAYELHPWPVTIEVNNDRKTAYIENDHRLRIDPTDDLKLLDVDGKIYVQSVECALGHELTHAGQEGAHNSGLENIAWYFGAETKFWERFHPDEKDASDKLRSAVKSTPDYDTALKLLEDYANRYAIDLELAIPSLLAENHYYRENIEKFEDPAVATEHRIARLRGEPLRSDYLNCIPPSREEVKDKVMARLMRIHQIDRKPRLPATTASDDDHWQRTVTEPKPPNVPPPNPRVADYRDGGHN